MIIELLKIIVAGILAMALVIPIVCLFDKWNKEMKADEENSKRDC